MLYFFFEQILLLPKSIAGGCLLFFTEAWLEQDGQSAIVLDS